MFLKSPNIEQIHYQEFLDMLDEIDSDFEEEKPKQNKIAE